MTKLNKSNAVVGTFEGFDSARNSAVGIRLLPSPTLYRANFPFLPHPTEGIIFPIELANASYQISVGVDTADLPVSALVEVLLVAVDGSATYKSPPEGISPPELLMVEIPLTELFQFEGKEIAISYTVNVDGQSTTSLTLPIRVTRALKYDKPVVEGLENGEIIVADYPDGLSAEIQPIENIAFPSIVTVSWQVLMRVNGIIVGLYELRQRFDAAPGEKYFIRVPKEAYMGWPKEAYGVCGGSVDFAPHDPNLPTYGTGAHTIKFV